MERYDIYELKYSIDIYIETMDRRAFARDDETYFTFRTVEYNTKNLSHARDMIYRADCEFMRNTWNHLLLNL